ncbi:MAG: DUF1996 domain-containing protein [Acidimicrobiales bacterium]
MLVAAVAMTAIGVTVEPAAAVPELVGGRLRVACGYSHRLADDPIVYPGQSGRSHLHEFFGNITTDAHSTYDTLRAGETTSSRPADASAYWVPMLLQDGQPVIPLGLVTYYTHGEKDPSTIQAHPEGLRVIAGDAHASAPQPRRIVEWRCVDGVGLSTGTVPTCLPGAKLQLVVRFPDCWDGRNLDSADHRSHMAYSMPNGLVGDHTCPPTHPVPVPTLQVEVNYDTVGGSGVTLSSGSANTAHADFFNAWDQAELERQVSRGVKVVLAPMDCQS